MGTDRIEKKIFRPANRGPTSTTGLATCPKVIAKQLPSTCASRPGGGTPLPRRHLQAVRRWARQVTTSYCSTVIKVVEGDDAPGIVATTG